MPKAYRQQRDSPSRWKGDCLYVIREAISAVTVGIDLTEDEAALVMEELMTDQATPSQAAALLVGLHMKGETVDEITGMVRVMRQKVLFVDVGDDVLDVVSTGGGAFDPFNISTAAAIICAGAGVRVAKHGNRGFTSVSGAADVLEALGAKIELTPEQAQSVITQTGFGFLFAQAFHPSMRFVGPTRREIGIRTIFNSLGPLTNPAGARYHLTGAGNAAIADKVAQVLRRLGTGRSLVVHSEDGLDEVSLGAPTTVHEVGSEELKTYSIEPTAFGMKPVELELVKTGSKAENAERLRAVLEGAESPDTEYSLANAGVALYAAERVSDFKAGVQMARESIRSGAAKRVLDAYIVATNSFDG
jgi:anthranilate phosphoribosyltransferase